jgi:hypothetical protein
MCLRDSVGDPGLCLRDIVEDPALQTEKSFEKIGLPTLDAVLELMGTK